MRQKAFRRGDGLNDNIWVLRSLIKDRTARIKNLNIAFVDVAKAFDSVSHESIAVAARRLGVSSHFIEYIRNLYASGTTCLRVGAKQSGPLPVRRGVRQGDPMSPILFNLVMDLVLANLDPGLGVRLTANTKVNHLAFADDVVLVAETRMGLQALARQFESGLEKKGLRVNPTKSATLSVFASGKRKKWVCGSEPFWK